MIEVREVPVNVHEDEGDKEPALFLNGRVLSKNTVDVAAIDTNFFHRPVAQDVPDTGSKAYHIVIYDEDIAKEILDEKVSAIASRISYIVFRPSLFRIDTLRAVDRLEVDFGSGDSLSVNFNLSFQLLWWSESYSFGEFITSFLERYGSSTAYEKDFDEDTLVLDIVSRDMRVDDRSLIEFVSPVISDIRRIYSETLLEFASPASVSLYFDFPENVKVPCEQYLLYFAQFLKDVGMHATADIKHEAGGVLFTVTPNGGISAPEDPEEALSAIRQALGVYLRLPTNPIILQTPVHHQPVEVQMLAATIKHLDSQLDYANGLAQMQAVTIQNQQAHISDLTTKIATLPQPVTAEVFVESVRAVVDKDKDKEAFLGGTVELTKYEGQGFNLNLAAAFRHVKGLFVKDSNVTPPTQELAAKQPAQLPYKRQDGEE